MPDTEVVRFDAVQVATDDLARATRAYATLLAMEPARTPAGTPRFALTRGAVELVSGAPGAQALRFAVVTRDDAALAAARAARFGGLRVATDGEPPGDPARHAALPDDAAPGFLAVDHVVVETPDPERAVRLWRDTLGLRLALDREFPGRGLRMLFFRTAGVTLELVSALGARGGPESRDDVLNGIAYRVAGIDACRARLLAAGLDVSEVRTGNKPGTRVATVRSGTEGVPTLLIEAVAGALRA
jgi:catechol 2,3-dioxygenase-like lactoylglutathione lyase family enzyme